MNKHAAFQSGFHTDPYVTRLSDDETRVERKDPVVWGAKAPSTYLDQDEIDSNERNGLLIKRDLFDAEDVKALLAAATALREADADTLGPNAVREPGSKALRTLFQLERHHPLFDALARSERVAGIARQILDDEVYIHQSRLNYKPGYDGEPFYWHSDFETWHAEDGMPRMRALSASILLTDNDALNGPLMLMPGTQNHFVGCRGRTPENNYETSLKQQKIGTPSRDALAWMAREFGIDYAEGKAGTVIFFDCNTMHGSNGNITPFPRSNAFFVYNAVSNRLQAPFAANAARPDFLANRAETGPLAIEDAPLKQESS